MLIQRATLSTCQRLSLSTSASLANQFKEPAEPGQRRNFIERRNGPKSELEPKKEGEEEQYREMFLMPKRKLQTQLRIEQMTGRAEDKKKSQRDIMDRMTVRSPRREEMPFDQDWPSVWPAAATFRSSVVPLPVRMGTRKKPENRPPFKTFGNLELLKIPNFLHLTPEHIRRHCEAIKHFCTPFPKELKEDPSLIVKHMPLTISYSDFVHQGTSIRDIRARVVTMKINVSHLRLDPHAWDKLRRLVGNRYDNENNMLTIVSDRCFTRKQNREYVEYLMTVLYHESNKVEEWEKEKQRADNLKVEFEGSLTQSRIAQFIEATKLNGSTDVETAKKLKPNDPTVKEFADVWKQYRNTKETPESTRQYTEAIRKIYGVPSFSKQIAKN